MQGHCEIDADFLAAALHHRDHATGRKRDATLRKGQPVPIHHKLERVADVVEIVQRLTHAHHHDVGEQASVSSVVSSVFCVIEPVHHTLGPFSESVTREHHLPDDFTRCQVADQPHRAGGAKGAVERAADLAGYAQCPAIRIGDKDHFEIVTIGGLEQPFARAVRAVLCLDHIGATDDEALGQPRAHGLGDIGHRLEFGHAAMIQPVVDLLGPQLGLLCVEASFGKQFANS